MTQIELARRGILSNELMHCSKSEGIEPEKLRRLVADGLVVIPKNKYHKMAKPTAIGGGLSVKINANIGTSVGYSSFEEEIEKLRVAVESGADTVMILSTWGNLSGMRKELLKESPIPVGSVPIYDSAVLAFKEKKNVVDFSESDFIKMVLQHAEDGIDFMTIHVGITKRVLEKLKTSKRILKVVSRGGSIIVGWMIKNGKENPFYTNFDEILKIAKEYDITLSLGDGMRPGAVVDSTDIQQIEELFYMQELVERANAEGVQVMLEGPGHVPLNEIEMNVKLMKNVGLGRPIFMLGPLPTDRGVGHDHIVGAIGGALAGYYGCDFLCYVTPAEHVGLPDAAEVKEGIIASKIAAAVANVARGIPMAIELEREMAVARRDFDWNKIFELAIDPERAMKKHKSMNYKEDGCSMCGPFCAIKITSEYSEDKI
jgi:phosphomethylpyrimidine synthase